jgi:hypothetical protein
MTEGLPAGAIIVMLEVIGVLGVSWSMVVPAIAETTTE